MAQRFEVHVDGLGFPEGPVGLPDGRIAFVDLLHHNVRIFEGTEVNVLAGLPGSPNGMRLGPDGALLVANNGGIAPLSVEELWYAEPQVSGRIQRVSLDGSLSDLAVDLPGDEPSRPNDLVISPSGDVLYTDPHNWEVLPDEDAYGGGRVGVVRADGRVELLCIVPGFPNGICFAPDGALLVAQTMLHRVLRYEWDGDRVHGEPTVWAQLPEHINPDGMVWDHGALYLAGSVGDEVLILDEEGRVVHREPTGRGSDPTNVCVHENRLWVTLGLPGQLISFDLADLQS